MSLILSGLTYIAPLPAIFFKLLEVTTNLPTACASSIGIPNPSYSERNNNMSVFT